MEGVKIYGLCPERLRHQINNARGRNEETYLHGGTVLLESYNTGDLDDIVDILELYDLEDRIFERLTEKLDELAYTISVLARESLIFDYDERGHLGLYLVGQGSPLEEKHQPGVFALSASA